MFIKNKVFILFTIIICNFITNANVSAQVSTNIQLSPAITYTQIRTTPTESPLVINLITVDMANPDISIKSELGRGKVITDEYNRGREKIGDLAIRTGAIAAINADYFSTDGDPLGFMIRDGELISESMPSRVAMGITDKKTAKFGKLKTTGTVYTADGASFRLAGINKIISSGMLVYTPSFGPKTVLPDPAFYAIIDNGNKPVKIGTTLEGIITRTGFSEVLANVSENALIVAGRGKEMSWLSTHTRPGEKIKIRFDVTADTVTSGNMIITANLTSTEGITSPDNWSDVIQSVSGGPWLVRNGVPYIDGELEGFNTFTFINQKHPRSGVGVTAEGKLIIVAIDGRRSYSNGVTLKEMADIMVRFGAVNAINLDGGGSTELALKGIYVNGPSENPPRPIANALAVYDASYHAITANAQVSAKTIFFRPGETITINALSMDGNLDKNFLWGCIEGTAFVDQKGLITTDHTTGGSIVLLDGNKPTICYFRASYDMPKKQAPTNESTAAQLMDSNLP